MDDINNEDGLAPLPRITGEITAADGGSDQQLYIVGVDKHGAVTRFNRVAIDGTGEDGAAALSRCLPLADAIGSHLSFGGSANELHAVVDAFGALAANAPSQITTYAGLKHLATNVLVKRVHAFQTEIDGATVFLLATEGVGAQIISQLEMQLYLANRSFDLAQADADAEDPWAFLDEFEQNDAPPTQEGDVDG